MTDYDVIVIGAGQAGPGVAAARAGQGKKVALIEMARAGGTCLNHGCKPTKALRASASVAHSARRAAAYGVSTGPVSVDFGVAIGRVHRLVDQMIESLDGWIRSVDGLDYLEGRAAFTADPSGVAHRVTVNGETHTASEVHLDIGGRASVPDVPGLRDAGFLTETELLHLTELPRHLVIIGGGYIGLEFGQMFRRFGADVTMLVGRGIAGREDPDVATILTEVLTREGVALLEARPASVARSGDDVEVVLDDGRVVHGSHVLVATGRLSNADLLGEHGLETDDRGFFTIGDRFETSVPGVFALGDVNGHGAFTHTAYQDSQILLAEDRTVAGRVSTYAMFTDPVLGRVGMSSAEARESSRRVLKAEVPMSSVSRAILEGETDGVLRILVDEDSEEILGATVLGLHADDLVQQISLAVQAGLRYPVLRDMLPIHPTMAEFIPSVLGSLAPLD